MVAFGDASKSARSLSVDPGRASELFKLELGYSIVSSNLNGICPRSPKSISDFPLPTNFPRFLAMSSDFTG